VPRCATTFVKKVVVKGRHVKQSGGHGQYAVCDLEIEPLPRGGGFEFVDKVVGGAVPRNFIPSVEKGARSQMEKGVLAGYPLVDVRVTLFDGKAHSVDSSDMAFQTAAAMALKEAANESSVALLEPVDAVDITVSDDFVGAVMSDLRGQVLGTEPAVASGWTVVHAEVPQTESSRYPIDLRSVSHGTGSFTRRQLRYDYMPAEKATEYAKAAKDWAPGGSRAKVRRGGRPRGMPPRRASPSPSGLRRSRSRSSRTGPRTGHRS